MQRILLSWILLIYLLNCCKIIVADNNNNNNNNNDDNSYIFFIKGPTSPATKQFPWSMLQQEPESFSISHFRSLSNALNITDSDKMWQNSKMKIGFTFQWETLDCFLSPHSCTISQVKEGIENFLNSAVATKTPVEITLDPVQFYYSSNLWNWYDPKQPGFNENNVNNVEWTSWSSTNATMISWRNWGQQFRMPTPQPNLASPALIKRTKDGLFEIISAIRDWYDRQKDVDRKVLISIKLGEEVDVGANFYYYPNGNEIYRNNPTSSKSDPTYGLNSSKGLFGGLQPQGYNMLQTLKIRTSGPPPTREEITFGIKNYFKEIISSCVKAWPDLMINGILATHGGAISDPLRIQWDAPMVIPATPGYSSYFGPSQFPSRSGKGNSNPVAQPGLKVALNEYNMGNEFIVAEAACFGCHNVSEWVEYFHTIFSNPYGKVKYMRYYNIEPFLSQSGSIEGLHEFVASYVEDLEKI